MAEERVTKPQECLRGRLMTPRVEIPVRETYCHAAEQMCSIYNLRFQKKAKQSASDTKVQQQEHVPKTHRDILFIHTNIKWGKVVVIQKIEKWLKNRFQLSNQEDVLSPQGLMKYERSALWQIIMHSGKKWWIRDLLVNPEYVAAHSLRSLHCN